MLSSNVPSAAYRGGEVIAVYIRDLSTRGGGVNNRPRSLCSRKRALVPIVQEDGWVSRPVWMGAENVASLQGFESRTVQLVASRCINYTIPAAIYLLSKLPFLTRKSFSALRRVWLE
jgi:hypothetical protein